MKRLASIDALRGFDMSFIMGGEELVVAVAVLLGFADFGRVFGHVSWHGLQIFDPEGFAGHIPAIVTAMLGMFAGEVVRKAEWSLDRKAWILAAMGVGLLAVGYVWSFVFPVNKALWSPSFVLVVGGISSLAFAFFFWIVDVKGKVAWTFPFRVIGMNSILIYMLQAIVPMEKVNRTLFGGFASLMPHLYAEAFLWATYMLVCWYILYICYKKQLFLKV